MIFILYLILVILPAKTGNLRRKNKEYNHGSNNEIGDKIDKIGIEECSVILDRGQTGFEWLTTYSLLVTGDCFFFQ